MSEDLLQGEFLLFLVEVRKSVQTEGHPQGVHVLLQGLVLVVQTTGRFQQFVQVVFRLLYRAFHLKKKMKSETCRGTSDYRDQLFLYWTISNVNQPKVGRAGFVKIII